MVHRGRSCSRSRWCSASSSVTSEFRHGTITPSLLVVPDRVAARAGQARARRSWSASCSGCVAERAHRRLIVKGIGGARDLDTSGDGAQGDHRRRRSPPALFAALGRRRRRRSCATRSARSSARSSTCSCSRTCSQIIPGRRRHHRQVRLRRRSATACSAPTRTRRATCSARCPAGLLLAAYAAIFVVIGILVMQRRDVTA